MSSRFLTIILLAFGFCLQNINCVSSEETGAGDRARSPVHTVKPVDTTRRFVERKIITDTTQKIDAENFGGQKQERIPPKFKSKQDTIRASMVTKKKNIANLIQIEIPENPFYTVQIGAFAQMSNALQAHKKAKERFTYQPVFNNYLEKANIYRVSVGRYEERKDAFSLRDTLKRLYPTDYYQCWINYIP